MEQQKTNNTLMRLSDFALSLRNNSSMAIASLNKLHPEVVEQVIERSKEKKERLDSLHRGLQFFKKEYQGEDKTKYIVEIEAEISEMQTEIEKNPSPPTISELNNTYPTECKKGVMLLINDLREFFLVDNILNTQAIKNLSQLIIEEYGGLTLEEVGICFTHAKKGHYGKVYNRLDGQIILGWLLEFKAEKTQRIIDNNHAKHAQDKADIDYRRIRFNASTLLNQIQAQEAIENAKRD